MNAVLSKVRIILVVLIAIALAVVLLAYAGFTASHVQSGSAAGRNLTIGDYAPNTPFYFANGTESNVSSYKGKEIVLWFVATWCSGCAQGDEMLNSSYSAFKYKGVKVIELELYNDLGYQGENITSFVSGFAHQAYLSNAVTPAYASYNMTLAYDPNSYLDIYYLISPTGRILYTNTLLASTLPELLYEINKTV